VALFVLVHGAWHGAWCWERFAPELRNRGHDVLALDLPTDDVSAGCVRYAEIVADAISDSGHEVVLLGHSLAGLTIPLVAARRPVSRLVFLSAFIPVPGSSLIDQLHEDPSILSEGFDGAPAHDELGRSYWDDLELARRQLFSSCDEDLAAAAAARLRVQARAPLVEPCPRDALPDVPAVYVLGNDDAVVRPAWSQRAARERLGVDAAELDGGHALFLSHPAELAELVG
jgi:alpha-beta hydrolase superfamily lysophospholipase